MSENASKIPLPAIVFIAVLLGCILILAILYQLLKRDKCCQVHGREGADEEEQEELIPQTEGENQDGEQTQTVPKEGTEQPDGPEGLGTVVAGSSIGSALVGIGTSASGVALPVTPGSITGSAKGGSAGGGSAAGAPAGNTSIDLSESAASFPSIELLPQEDEPVSHCGRLLLETTFSPIANKMIITVVRAADVPGVDRGGTAMVEVHLTILQDKFKKFKFRTSARPSNSPVYNERFTLYPVTLKLLEELSIRVRLYGKKAFGKKVLGEVEVLMTDIDLHSDLSDEPMWKTLLPYGMVEPVIRAKSSASEGSGPKTDPAEVQISLHYKSVTGRLEVCVMKARSLSSILPSAKSACYVTILCLGPQDFSAQSKTKSRKGLEPEFNETFIFTMGHDEIPEVGLTFSLKTGNTVLGWFSLGRNFSGTREERMWNALSENCDVTLRQWIRLLSAG